MYKNVPLGIVFLKTYLIKMLSETLMLVKIIPENLRLGQSISRFCLYN